MSRDKEKQLQYSRDYRLRNVDKIAAIRRKNRAADPAKFRMRSAKWRKNNPLSVRAHSAAHRALQAAAGKHTANDIKDIHRLQRGRCAICCVNLRDAFHVDHIHPLYLGGSNEKWNIQILCPTCNISKGAKDPIDHAQRIGRLL